MNCTTDLEIHQVVKHLVYLSMVSISIVILPKHNWGQFTKLTTYNSIGSRIELFEMDLNFDGVYRLNQIGKMILPTEHANFLTIIPVISNFYSLLVSV